MNCNSDQNSVVNKYHYFIQICTILPMNVVTKQVNTLRPRQDGRRFPDDIFKWIFLNEIIWISIKISLTFVHRGPINNIPSLVQIMAWRQPGDKPLSEPMMVRLATHICVTRPQWVKINPARRCCVWNEAENFTIVKTSMCRDAG